MQLASLNRVTNPASRDLNNLGIFPRGNGSGGSRGAAADRGAGTGASPGVVADNATLGVGQTSGAREGERERGKKKPRRMIGLGWIEMNCASPFPSTETSKLQATTAMAIVPSSAGQRRAFNNAVDALLTLLR